MVLDRLLVAAEAQIPDSQPDGTLVSMPVGGRYTVRHKEITGFQSLDIGPFASLILRGRKEGKVGDHVVEFAQGQTSILSHHVPVQYRIAEVGDDGPFIALFFNLDFGILRQLESRIEKLALADETYATLDIVQPDNQLHNTLERYAKLDSSVVENEILGPSILEEVHFRLLQSKNAGMLRQLLKQDSNARKIADAILLIRNNLKAPPNVSDLAAHVQMGSSSFYRALPIFFPWLP